MIFSSISIFCESIFPFRESISRPLPLELVLCFAYLALLFVQLKFLCVDFRLLVGQRAFLFLQFFFLRADLLFQLVEIRFLRAQRGALHGEEGAFPLQFVAEIVEGVSFFLQGRFARGERLFDIEQLFLLFRDKGKVVVGVAVRNQAVDDRAGIFPFGQIALRHLFSLFRETEIFPPAAVGKVTVIGFDVFQGFEAL